MKTVQYGIGLFGLVIAVALGGAGVIFSVHIVSDGLRPVQTLGVFRQARDDWQHGRVLAAGQRLLRALGMTLDGGLRSQIARRYLAQASRLSEQGKLHEALSACVAAVHILGRYDSEGATSYVCYAIDFRIQYPTYSPAGDPTAAPGSEP